MQGRPSYPFTALVGQSAMKLALVLNAVNPRLGGVLIRGEKGTAKSTAARGLVALLPPLCVVEGCRFACDPNPGSARCPECAGREAAGEQPLPQRQRPAAFVELPTGATEDRVLGTLDLERAIQAGERHFDPGLLARANRGLLYVDEVNLLPDHLVDVLLDAAAMGVNSVEREGISFTHPAAFVLVGTMNPEEGDLRPQLLDRFALTCDVTGTATIGERAEVVRRRIAFEADPTAFQHAWGEAETAERRRIAAARQRLPRVCVPDPLLELIAKVCAEFGVDGMRADIAMYKAAATLAAYEGRLEATPNDVSRAAELALPHRQRRQPFDEPGLDRDRLNRMIQEHEDDPDDSGGGTGTEDGRGPVAPSGGGTAAPPAGGGLGRDETLADAGPGQRGDAAHPDRGCQPSQPGQRATDGPTGSDAAHCGGSDDAAEVFEIGRAPHPGRLPEPPPARVNRGPGGPAIGAPTAVRGSRGNRHPSTTGRHVRNATPIPGESGSLDVFATIRAAAPSQPARRVIQPMSRAPAATRVVVPALRIEWRDVRVKVREARQPGEVLFVVDASGSMAAQRRMVAAKGAVLSLLLDAYQQRDRVGLIAFRQADARLLLPLTTSTNLAHTRLRSLPTGGRTPLAAGLWLAWATLSRGLPPLGGGGRRLLVLVSDGRANVAQSSGDAFADALGAAAALRGLGVTALVVDAEEGPIRLGLARRLSDALGGDYVRLAEVNPARPGTTAADDRLAAKVRGLQSRPGGTMRRGGSVR